MPRKNYEYSKLILESVSFDVKLFTKELQKAMKQLLPFELEDLKLWLIIFTKERPELRPTIVLLS